MKKMHSLIGLVALSFALVGCNTARGLGKDVERGGEKVQDVAKDVQKKM